MIKTYTANAPAVRKPKGKLYYHKYITKAKAILAWHIVPKNGKLNFTRGRIKAVAGTTYVWSGIGLSDWPVLCSRGLHASRRLSDALGYGGYDGYLCRVLVWGIVEKESDKLVGTHRKILWMEAFGSYDEATKIARRGARK